MATQPSNPINTDNNENEQFSLPKFFARLFNLLADLCKDSADKEAEKGDEKNKPAYLATRFFQYLFSSVAFLTEHIVSWIINPKSIINDFQAVVDFFTDLGQKITDWWNEVTGKKPVAAPVNNATHVNTSSLLNDRTEVSHDIPEPKAHKSTMALLSGALGQYQKENLSKDDGALTKEEKIISEEKADLKTLNRPEEVPAVSYAPPRTMR